MKVNTRISVVLAIVGMAWSGLAVESHVDSVVNEVLANVAKIKAADPAAVPMAFWDFDGTIIKGDVSDGLVENGEEKFQGLMKACILGGWSSVYKGEEGWRQYKERDYRRLNQVGRFIAWPYNAQIFAGAKQSELDEFCRRRFREVYRKWYFTSSVAIMRRLEAAGVENHIVSASPEIFVQNAAESLGLARDRMNAIRVGVDGGRITTRLEEPVPFGEGKVEVVRRIVNACPHGHAVAGFGNSYQTDGPFLRYIVSQRSLPGGAKGFALMINGFEPLPGYEGLFTCVNESEVGE